MGFEERKLTILSGGGIFNDFWMTGSIWICDDKEKVEEISASRGIVGYV